MWYEGASTLQIVGTLLMVAFFVIVGLFNLKKAAVEDHINRARAAKTPLPAFVFWFGIALEFVSAALIVTGWNARLGVIGLIVFTVFATAIYLRFWEREEPMVRLIQRNVFLANMAIVGGLILMYENIV